MITGTSRSQAIQYISERRCPSGGYCFYRLDEPNAADAWYALSSLSMLGGLSRDRQTESLILSLQREDGSFSSIYIGYYSLKSLHLLGISPRVLPVAWIDKQNPVPTFSGARSVESTSYFETAFLFVQLCLISGIQPGTDLRSSMIEMVLSRLHPDGGFGYHRSTLVETRHAVAILLFLGHPLDLHGVKRFITLCENRTYGFMNIPGACPSFLEHFHAGIAVSSLIGYESCIFPRCRQILLTLQSANGGFVRSIYGGSPTLEFTFLALEGLHLIDSFFDRIPCGRKTGMQHLLPREEC
jgi:hypothetical protein